MLTGYPDNLCSEPERRNSMGRELSSEVQSEVVGAAVACLETKVNWCVAIRDEVALYEQKHHGAWEAKLNNEKLFSQQLQPQSKKKVDIQ